MPLGFKCAMSGRQHPTGDTPTRPNLPAYLCSGSDDELPVQWLGPPVTLGKGAATAKKTRAGVAAIFASSLRFVVPRDFSPGEGILADIECRPVPGYRLTA